MAGQYKTMFLMKISKRIFKSTTPVTQKFRPRSIQLSICKFTLLTLLLPSLLIQCTTASPLEPMPDASQNVIQDDAPQNNKAVDISKINSELGLFQGDMRLSSFQQSLYEIITTRKFYPQIPLPERMIEYWEYGIIYYDTSDITDARLLRLINNAIRDFGVTDLIFLTKDPYTTDYLKFTENDGCWSYLGKQGGIQEIAMGSHTCRYRNVVVHLIFHSLGFVHEESRPDRNRNVEIDFNNVAPGKETNFDILPEDMVRSNGTNYNYHSILHSLKKSASEETRDGYKQTIRPLLEGKGASNFGSINSLTPIDITRVKSIYLKRSIRHGDWSHWSAWSPCSVTCSSGMKSRTRICFKPDSRYTCSGSNIEFTRCHRYACIGEVRAHWGTWGEWSLCSASCDGGRQVRVRQCVGADVCTKGKGRQYRSCGLYRCPSVPGSGWQSWSQWSSCSQSCHYGFVGRTRVCAGGGCIGARNERKICNYKIPCSPVWGQWSDWSDCVNEKISRMRSCNKLPYMCRGAHTEELNCEANSNTNTTEALNTSSGELPTTDRWSSWSPCSSNCGPGHQTRTNSCGQLGECRQMLILLAALLYIFPHIIPHLFLI